MKNIAIILPTLNEEGNIGRMLDTLLKLYPSTPIIVSDDGSKDKTQEIVNEFSAQGVILLDRGKEKVKGLTASVLDAASKAKTKNIIVMDCDFQHPPEKVGEIAAALEKYDLVVGARTGTPGWSLKRKLISIGGTILAAKRMLITFRRPIPDPMSGFFGIRTELIQKANKNHFVPEGFKVLFDVAKGLPRSTRIGKVNYTFGLRTAGESKISKRHLVCMLKSLIR